MALEYSFQLPLPNGLHARPASELSDAVSSFRSQITLINDRNGRSASARSVLALVGMDCRHQDPCRLVLSGEDETRGLEQLRHFINIEFAKFDEPIKVEEVKSGEVVIPPSLAAAGLTLWHAGVTVCGGIGWGKVVVGSQWTPPTLSPGKAQDPKAEREKVQQAFASVDHELSRQLSHCGKSQEGGVLKAHLGIVRDETLSSRVFELIEREQMPAGQAVIQSAAYFESVLSASESLYLRERILDIRDVCARLLEALGIPSEQPALPVLTEPSVVVAESLMPGELLSLNRELLRGLVLGDAGTTSHTVILARSFGIPTITGVARATGLLQNGQEIVVDADLGLVAAGLNDAIRDYYHQEQKRHRQRRERFARFREITAVTADGQRLEIAANISTADEAATVFAGGAEGIGLYRTEMLFLDRDQPPTEEEQFSAYSRAVLSAKGRPVIIRTFDIGGDKPAPYLKLAEEMNPFLGIRGVRLYKTQPEMLRTQLRAILRAGAGGPVKIMVPMVASADEVRWMKERVSEVEAQLLAEGKPTAKAVPVGIMVEVPGAAFAIRALCEASDFFSIGTNDLFQYFFAVDRGNSALASRFSPKDPAFLGLLNQIVSAARERGKWIGVCGELAGDINLLPLWVGMGLSEISLGGSTIPALKAALAKIRLPDCHRLLEETLTAVDASAVDRKLREFARKHTQGSILDDGLILFDVASNTKVGAIREMVNALYVHGRAERPHEVELAVWAREKTYSTGFGNGFAIPHGKTDAVSAASLVVARLRHPVEWGASDGQPVRVILMLLIPATDAASTHMKVLSQLARKLMHEEFRQRLAEEKDSKALGAFLRETLGIA